MLDHFGFLAPFYDRFIGPPDRENWKRLLDLPATGLLLDAGGGTGRVSAQLRPFIDNIIISDESAQMLSEAKGKAMCCPVLGHVETLPFPDNAFTRIMVVDALHHFADQQQAIAEFVRILAPNGRLVIEEPDLHKFSVKLVALAEKIALMRSKFYYPEAIRDMIAVHGLDTRLEADGRFTAWVIAEKS